MTTEDRFWTKVEKTGGCWNWIAGTNHYGYGSYRTNRESGSFAAQAHRYAYETLVGPIPDGLTLDHLCRNPRCVNPDHLEPVTRGENVLRGNAPSALHARGERCGGCSSCRNAAKTHCKRGHELQGDNLYVAKNGMRSCRRCATLRMRWRRERERAAA